MGGRQDSNSGPLFLSAVSVRKPAVASVPRGPRPFSLPTASDHGPGRDVRWTAKAVPRCQPGTPEPPPAIRSGLGGPPTSPRSGSRVAEQRGRAAWPSSAAFPPVARRSAFPGKPPNTCVSLLGHRLRIFKDNGILVAFNLRTKLLELRIVKSYFLSLKIIFPARSSLGRLRVTVWTRPLCHRGDWTECDQFSRPPRPCPPGGARGSLDWRRSDDTCPRARSGGAASRLTERPQHGSQGRASADGGL